MTNSSSFERLTADTDQRIRPLMYGRKWRRLTKSLLKLPEGRFVNNEAGVSTRISRSDYEGLVVVNHEPHQAGNMETTAITFERDEPDLSIVRVHAQEEVHNPQDELVSLQVFEADEAGLITANLGLRRVMLAVREAAYTTGWHKQ